MTGESPAKFNISTQTGVSIGFALVLLSGVAWLIAGQNDTKTSMRETKYELLSDMKDVKTRLASLEANKGNLTTTEFILWTIHLQQLNADSKKLQTEGLKVPEPQISK